MSEVHSVAAAFDGPTKCGKTSVIRAVDSKAEQQRNAIRSAAAGPLRESGRGGAQLLRSRTFNSIIRISAGNRFRAAALLEITAAESGRPLEQFEPQHADEVRALLETEAMIDRLQNDPGIADNVARVAQMAGVQALCGELFSDDVVSAYLSGGGGNLVVVDARDPVGVLVRNGRLGTGSGQVLPASILPIYLDAPAHIAAGWSGDYETELARIEKRRHDDATRTEFPVVKPPQLIDDLGVWSQQFNTLSPDEVAVPYEFRNDEHMTLDGIQNFAGQVAALALDRSVLLANA
jgi:hypothetical protein